MSRTHIPDRRMDERQCADRVVAIGGGTGLPVVLGGLRDKVLQGQLRSLTAVVAVSDDGGSSGRLRRARGLPPPGDIRNCLVALSPGRGPLSDLFQYRYSGSKDVGGHTVGNLILAALTERSGSLLAAVETAGQLLGTIGRILPSTLDDVILEAILDDRTRITGETNIRGCHRKIQSIAIRPQDAAPTPGIIDAIEQADLVVLGPGSLYTSLVPHLAVRRIADAIRRTRAVKVLVANLVSEKGEAAGLDLNDHIVVLESHAGGRFLDAVLVNTSPIEDDILEKYRAEGCMPLEPPVPGKGGLAVIRTPLLAGGTKLRHDPRATADGLMTVCNRINTLSDANAS